MVQRMVHALFKNIYKHMSGIVQTRATRTVQSAAIIRCPSMVYTCVQQWAQIGQPVFKHCSRIVRDSSAIASERCSAPVGSSGLCLWHRPTTAGGSISSQPAQRRSQRLKSLLSLSQTETPVSCYPGFPLQTVGRPVYLPRSFARGLRRQTGWENCGG